MDRILDGIKMIKVSIIIPVYNAEKYLEKCLDCIIGQTLKEIEMICVDDGSTDTSLQILRSYAERDARIHIFTQKNQAAGVARNHGMEKASGKYLLFLDADDHFELDMIEKMYEKAEEGAYDVVICRYERYCELTKRILMQDWSHVDSFFIDKNLFSGNSLRYKGLFQITKGWAWDKLFQADFVRKCGYRFPEFRSSEDGFFVYMLMVRARRMAYMDDILVTHRVNDPNSLSNTKEKNWINGFKMFELIREELIRLDVYETYKRSFLNEILEFFMWYLRSLHSFEAYKNSFTYLQIVFEPAVGVLEHDGEYYFKKELFDRYKALMVSSLPEYLFQRKEDLIDQLEGMRRRQEKSTDQTWIFPYRSIPKGKNVVLYGAGKMGTSFYTQLTDSQFCNSILWVDSNYQKYADAGLPVKDPETIGQYGSDVIFIAIKDKCIQDKVKSQLFMQGVRPEQIKAYGQDDR